MHTFNKYLFFFTLLLLLSNHIPSAYSEQCLEVALFGNQRQFKSCPQVDDSKLLSDGNTKGLNYLEQSDGNSSMIQILFTCDQESKPELCDKAKIAFDNAATIVTNTFDLK